MAKCPVCGQTVIDKKDAKTYEEIITYLNKKTGRNFRPDLPATKKLINGRLKDGFKISDFKSVIDIKSSQWLGSEYERYLRPQTLFGTKFESYLMEVSENGKSGRNNPKDYAEGTW